MNNKVFIAAAIAVLVIGGVLMLRGREANEDPTAWKTYVNSDDGYSIMHPPEFWPQYDQDIMNYDIDDPRYVRGNPDGIKIQIQQHTLKEDFETFDEYIAYQEEKYSKDDPYNFDDPIERVAFGNFITLSQYTHDGPGGAVMTYMASKDGSRNYYYILVFESGYSKNVDLVEEIVSTFEIL